MFLCPRPYFSIFVLLVLRAAFFRLILLFLSKSCVWAYPTGLDLDIPLAGALAVGPWAGVPDTLVRHDCGSYVNDERGVVFLAARALVVDWSIVVGIDARGIPECSPTQICCVRAKIRNRPSVARALWLVQVKEPASWG